MGNLKEIVTGTQEQVLDEQIDTDKLYNLKDLFEMVTTTNAKMTTEYMQSGFYKKDAYVLCTDDGTYKKGSVYRFTGYSFALFATIPEIVTAVSALSTDEQVPSAKLLYDKLVELESLYAPKSAVQISDGGELGGIVRDTASNVMGGTINKDKLYNITDLQGIIITNAQMTAAITPAQEGLFKNKDIRYCIDEGTYEKGFYQFTVNYATSTASWVKVENGGAEVVVLESAGYSTLTDSMSTAVPTLTVQQVTDAYNAITAGKVVYIEDQLGDNRTMVLQKAPVNSELTIYCSYLSRLELAYTIREVDNVDTVVVSFKEIGGGGTQKYTHCIHFEPNAQQIGDVKLDLYVTNETVNPYTTFAQVHNAVINAYGHNKPIPFTGFYVKSSSSDKGMPIIGLSTKSDDTQLFNLTRGTWVKQTETITVEGVNHTFVTNVEFAATTVNFHEGIAGTITDTVIPL